MPIALITGASSGIGKEFALALKDRGISGFWLVARSTGRMEELAKELDLPCKIITADLTAEEGVAAVRSALEEEHPEIAYLVNAAGFGTFGTVDAISPEITAGMIDLNVRALALVTQMAVPFMTRGSHIIEMGSGSCFTPLPNFAIYSASKTFVLHYSKAIYYELKPKGISVTCFCPGWVNTPFLPKMLDAPAASVPKKLTPMLSPAKIVRGCVRAAEKGRKMYVTNWYTKLQHLLFKILPDGILSRLWLGMLTENPK